MLGFKEWLRAELIEDGIIFDDFHESDSAFFTLFTLESETEFMHDDLETYKNEYSEFCHNHNFEPVWDLEE